MRHVITGGQGFVGSRLAQTLSDQGQRVVIFDQAPPQSCLHDYVRGDIGQSADLERLALGPDDIVYHLAARQFHGPVPRMGRDAWFSDVNVLGTRHVLEAMHKGGAGRLLFFSTDMTYGLPVSTPIFAGQVQSPIGPYGRSKLAAETLILGAMRDFGLRATIFRPRLIAGAGRLGILSTLFRLIMAGAPVPMIGAGSNRYQMISVSDCVAAALKAVEVGIPTGAFNLGSDDPPTVCELLSGLILRSGSRSRLIATPGGMVKATLAILDKLGLTLLYPEQFKIADADYVLDTTLTRETFGWTPAHRDTDIMFEAYDHFAQA